VTIEKEFFVLLVHGEGDRDHVNHLARHRRNFELSNFARLNPGQPLPARLTAEPDEHPDVTVLLQDPDLPSGRPTEWTVRTWDEIEAWKALIGWDPEKRHWRHGAKVKLAIA